jgi:hypothetical protein
VTTDAEVITKARELSELGDFGEDVSQTLEQLADIAEKRGAMAQEALARSFWLFDMIEDDFSWDRFKPNSEHKEYMEDADKELDIESTSWRKIGPEDTNALQDTYDWMTGHLPESRNWMPKALDVLRRLIRDEA